MNVQLVVNLFLFLAMGKFTREFKFTSATNVLNKFNVTRVIDNASGTPLVLELRPSDVANELGFLPDGLRIYDPKGGFINITGDEMHLEGGLCLKRLLVTGTPIPAAAKKTPGRPVQRPPMKKPANKTKTKNKIGKKSFVHAAKEGSHVTLKHYETSVERESAAFLANGVIPLRVQGRGRGADRKSFKKNAKKRFLWRDGDLYKVYQTGTNTTSTNFARRVSSNTTKLVLTEAEAMDLLNATHCVAHDGMVRLRSIGDKYHINHLQAKIKQVCSSCEACQTYLPPPAKRPTAILTSRSLEIVMFDLSSVDAADDEGYKHFFLLVDHFTKYTWWAPLKTKSMEEVVGALKKLHAEKDIPAPERWHSDNGSEFINRLMDALQKAKYCEHTTSLPRNPQCQGLVERRNSTLKTKIYKIAGERDGWVQGDDVLEWRGILGEIIDNENNQKTRMYGLTPYFCYHGRHRDAGDHLPVHEASRAEVQEYMHAQQIKVAEKRLQEVDWDDAVEKYGLGDEVHVYSNRKLKKNKGAMPNWALNGRVVNISEVDPHYVLLRYATKGIQGEAAGTLAKRYVFAGQLKMKKKSETGERHEDDIGWEEEQQPFQSPLEKQRHKRGTADTRKPAASQDADTEEKTPAKKRRRGKEEVDQEEDSPKKRTKQAKSGIPDDTDKDQSMIGSFVAFRVSYWGVEWARQTYGVRKHNNTWSVSRTQ